MKVDHSTFRPLVLVCGDNRQYEADGRVALVAVCIRLMAPAGARDNALMAERKRIDTKC